MNTLPELVREEAFPLTGNASDYDSLLDAIADSEFVLIGEASHGTHEFYKERAVITKRLIQEKNFKAVAAEADWPDAYRANVFVRGQSEDADSVDSLSGFKRFPAWMWRNADVLDFIGWLRAYNDTQPSAAKAGFYGLDLYSLHSSIAAVLTYLDKNDPNSAARARKRYSCFERFGADLQSYGLASCLGMSPSCEKEVIDELVELRLREGHYLQRNGPVAADDYFYAAQNARVVMKAEEYYRTMFSGQVSSWNLRDQHMFETLEELQQHLRTRGQGHKVVVWAHNSHIGDARATEMCGRGQLNLGQLTVQKHGINGFLMGFTTSSGTVTAASEWDGPAERKAIVPALVGSYENVFHQVGYERFLLDLRADNDATFNLRAPRLERAIGVIYRPQTERQSHYFKASVPDQFDWLFHCDTTRAVEPLERTSLWDAGEVQETFPTGF